MSEETIDVLIHGETQDQLGTALDRWDNETSWYPKPSSPDHRLVPPPAYPSLAGNVDSGKAWDGRDKSPRARGFATLSQPATNGKSHWEQPWRPVLKHKESRQFLDASQDDGLDDQGWTERTQQARSNKARYTLMLSNLPSDVTHKDVTNIVRGGRLIDVWLRKGEQKAVVTFAEGAADFLSHAKRNGVYIGPKRVSISLHALDPLAHMHSRSPWIGATANSTYPSTSSTSSPTASVAT